MQSSIEEFQAAGVEVMALSVDPVEDSARLAEMLGLSYRLLSDPNLEAVDRYGLRHDVDGLGAVSRTATYVLDAEGVVRWEDFRETYRVRPRPEELLEILEGIS